MPTCYRCNRVLKNPVSITQHYGPVCWRKHLADLASTPTNETQDVIDLPFDPDTMDIVCQRDGNNSNRGGLERGRLHFNIPQRITKHSPTGFEWGYSGSGPSDFALNILAVFIGQQRAEENGLYHEFKRDFLSNLPAAGGTIRGQDIWTWIEGHAPAPVASTTSGQRHAHREQTEQLSWL